MSPIISKTAKKLMDEILSSTAEIRNEFPEVYYLLGETPLFLSYDIIEISFTNFEQYLTSLQRQLDTFRTNQITLEQKQ